MKLVYWNAQNNSIKNLTWTDFKVFTEWRKQLLIWIEINSAFNSRAIQKRTVEKYISLNISWTTLLKKVSVACSFSDLRTLTSSQTEGKRVQAEKTENFSCYEGNIEQSGSKAVIELSKRTVTDKQNQL